MKKILRLAAGAACAVIGTACAETGTTPFAAAGTMAAFESVPAGFSATSSSFAAAGDLGEAFHPRRGDGGIDDRGGARGQGGRGRRDGFGFLMGGGIGPEFLGEIGFGPGRGRGPFRLDSVGTSCVFSSATGIVTCGPITRSGLTLLTTATITTAEGTAQARIDSLTDRIVLTSEISGTKQRRDSATSQVAHQSTRTVAGLAIGSTRRTVDGIAVGTEKTTGTIGAGAFEALRTVNDTTAGIIIPLADGRPTYPVAGRVSRNMSVTITLNGAPTTHTRTEVVTYDGSASATVVITGGGVVKSCTMPLPRGRLVCP